MARRCGTCSCPMEEDAPATVISTKHGLQYFHPSYEDCQNAMTYSAGKRPPLTLKRMRSNVNIDLYGEIRN